MRRAAARLGAARLGVVAGVALLAARAAGAAPAAARAADPAAAWDGVAAAIAPGGAAVLEAPRPSNRIGRLGAGARVAVRAIAAGRGACRLWVGLAPRGWVCARALVPERRERGVRDPDLDVRDPDVASAPSAPSALDAAPPDHPGVRDPDLDVRDPDDASDASDASDANDGRHASDPGAAAAAAPAAGIDVAAAPPPGWPFAWVLADAAGGEVIARRAPRADAEEVRRYEDGATVPVIEEAPGWARVAAGAWLPRAALRVARFAERPGGVGPYERWIDVDLDEQVLVAFVGDRPAYATLVSTGAGGTPTGVFRIAEKAASVDMKSPPWIQPGWDHRDVPFAMSFRDWYALHGAYWRDRFGRPESHGCVNLAPAAAAWLFAWTAPALPPGWLQIEADGATGTAVRIHDHRAPDPPWRDWQGRALRAP